MLLIFGIILGLALAFTAGVVLYLHSLELPQSRQKDSPAPRPGLWFCAHRAKRWIPFQHMYLKITPRDPSWFERYPLIFSRKDSNGAPFCTLGAGPVDGLLRLEFNRGFDLKDPVSFEEACPSASIEEENGRIASILMCANNYKRQLPFTAVIQSAHAGYNCNAIMAAIAHRSGLPLPSFTRRFLLCIGVGRPVPEKFLTEASSSLGGYSNL